MDPLSDVLSLLKPRSYMFGGFEAGGDWSIRFGRHEGIKCYAIGSGQCWLDVEGAPEPVRLSTGDCFLLPRGWPFRLASDLALTSVDALSVFPRPANGGIAIWNGGGDFSSVGGHFTLAGEHAGIMLGMLPPIVHLKTEADKAALRWYLDRMRQELRERLPGGFLVVEHLVHMMLVQALRLHLAEGANGGVGWLFALADRQMGAAVAAMHENPERRWTLQLLAERVGMSRSSFALKFKEIVGVAPMDYLTRWRMLLAGDKLANSHDPIAVIATSVGYDSESAFSTAFRRIMGRSPRQYGQRRTPAPASEARATARSGVMG